MTQTGRDQTFAARLLRWFAAAQRDLPWRHSKDPWAIWVSEVMLQQTRVEAVRDAFTRFLGRYPTPADFATADDDDLLSAWRGLGYYRRARLLRDGARSVVRNHRGLVPKSASSLGELPGIGDYTAGAIASIAFGEAVPAVDGNVERVLSRHAKIDGNVKTAAAKRRIKSVVLARMDPGATGDFNQALMELGATICKPQNPDCAACPVATDCAARREDCIADLPQLPARKQMAEVHARAVLCRDRSGAALGSRNPIGAINEGQLDLPGAGVLVACRTGAELESAIRKRHGCEIKVGPELGSVRHGITHHRIALTVHEGLPSERANSKLEAATPNSPAWTTIARKVLQKLTTELDAS